MRYSTFPGKLTVVCLVALFGCTNEHVDLGVQSEKTAAFSAAGQSESDTGTMSSSPAQSNEEEDSADAESDFSAESAEAETFDADAAPLLEARTEATPECASLVSGPPRGFSCMHCMSPSAGGQAVEIVDMLKRSCLKNVGISFLIDGSFGYDANRAEQLVRSLSEGGRQSFVHLYLLNGASQRKYEDTPVDGIGTQISPSAFRRGIVNDDELRNNVKTVARRAASLARMARKYGAVVSVALVLEDNLDSESFDVLRSIVEPVLPSGLTIDLGRNPCPGCYSGNDDIVPDGYFREVHIKGAGGESDVRVATNDGFDVSLPSDSAGSLTLGQLSPARDWAASRNVLFLLWNAEQQGLSVTNGDISGEYVGTRERHYKRLSTADENAVIEFLRGK